MTPDIDVTILEDDTDDEEQVVAVIEGDVDTLFLSTESFTLTTDVDDVTLETEIFLQFVSETSTEAAGTESSLLLLDTLGQALLDD